MRVKTGVATKHHKDKYFKLAKGYYSDKSRKWRQVKQQVERSLRFAYRDRKNRKRVFRSLWITRLNAAARLNGLTYSELIHGLKLSDIAINRKQLSEIAVNNATLFSKIVSIAKESLTAKSGAKTDVATA